MLRSFAFPTARVTSLTALRGFATAPAVAAKLPELPYGYGDLQPAIATEIMQLHHQKHHQAYVTNYNAAAEKFLDAQAKNDIAGMIALHPALRFNGGGHVNHSLFWKNLAPPKNGGGGQPSGDLASLIKAEFGSHENFVAKFNAQAAGVQGSGWAWLGYNKEGKRVEITTTANQDPLTGLTPLLGVDVWEHAYYLQYKNVRPDYLKAIWQVVNWNVAAERLAAAKK